MINRNTMLTPPVYNETELQSAVLSEQDQLNGPPPRPTRRQAQSNDDRQSHMVPQMTRPVNNAMNSTVNRGFNKPQPLLQNSRNTQDGSGGQINLHNVPATTKGRTGYGALISYNGTIRNRNQNNTVDPFAKVNPKARKLIESVERNRHNTSERRTGSTGGSSTQHVDLTAGSSPTAQMMNQTAQNFYSPTRQQAQQDQTGARPNIQIQIPGA